MTAVAYGLAFPATRGILARRAGTSPPAFDPSALFSGGTGGWWNASDLATLYQDSAGTIPVSGADQPVARIEDKSGNGNHLIQTTASKSPILRNSGALWWLEFDGIDDNLHATFTLAQPFTRISAANLVGGFSAFTNCFYDGASAAALLRCGSSSPAIQIRGSSTGANDASHMTIGNDHVVTEVWDHGTATGKLAVDNNSYATGDPGTGDPGGLTVGTNRFGSTPLHIYFYGMILIGRLLTDTGAGSETANCRTYFGNLAGLAL